MRGPNIQELKNFYGDLEDVVGGLIKDFKRKTKFLIDGLEIKYRPPGRKVDIYVLGFTQKGE